MQNIRMVIMCVHSYFTCVQLIMFTPHCVYMVYTLHTVLVKASMDIALLWLPICWTVTAKPDLLLLRLKCTRIQSGVADYDLAETLKTLSRMSASKAIGFRRRPFQVM